MVYWDHGSNCHECNRTSGDGRITLWNMTYFTSDTHFGHTNIIKYCNRPFASVEEMNESLIKNWNARVEPKDTIYHLGDFAFIHDEKALRTLFYRLKGYKHLIMGNHDKHNLMLPWEEVTPYKRLNLEGDAVILFHYGCRVWDKSHHGSIQLYGHSHGTLPGNSQQLDVGVDCWDYKPITLSEIKARLKTLPPFKGPDFHGS
jgi:calcineurin-like phosphoesterase family protein